MNAAGVSILSAENGVKCTHRVDGFMLGEAQGGNPINSDSQDGDDQMDKCDPV